jgi:hypothetical protein
MKNKKVLITFNNKIIIKKSKIFNKILKILNSSKTLNNIKMIILSNSFNKTTFNKIKVIKITNLIVAINNLNNLNLRLIYTVMSLNNKIISMKN